MSESTITRLSMRNKQWQKHHEKDQTTANRTTVIFFLSRNRGMATGILPREFLLKQLGILRLKQSGKITVAIPRLLLRKKKIAIRFAVVWSFFWCFCYCLFLIGNFVIVDSPRFPKYSGIDPKKAPLKIQVYILTTTLTQGMK